MFPTFATSPLREILAAKGGKLCGREIAGKFSLKMPDFHVAFRDILHAVNLRHGTHSFTSLPKGRRDDFFALKNLTASAGFEPSNLDSKGQHATSRPQKPLNIYLHFNTTVPRKVGFMVRKSKTDSIPLRRRNFYIRAKQVTRNACPLRNRKQRRLLHIQ
jgi:hypothetical protein